MHKGLENVISVEEKASTMPELTETVESESEVKPIEKMPEDEETERAAIISELQQVALNDDEKFTKSKQIKKLIEELGADRVNQLKTPKIAKFYCARMHTMKPVQVVDLAALTFLEALHNKNVVKTAYNAAF